MSYCWPQNTVFHHMTLDVEDRSCVSCGGFLEVYSHRQRRFFTFEGPIHLTSKLARCFRDAHVVTQHIAVQEQLYERTGKYFLGLGFQPFG